MRNEEMFSALLVDIHEHLEKFGSKQWKLVREQYPEISDRTFWRAVDLAKRGISEEELLQGAVKKAKRAAMRDLAPDADVQTLLAHLSPRVNIEYSEKLCELLEDAELLLEWSSTRAEDGTRVIKNPQYFTKAINLRRDILFAIAQSPTLVNQMKMWEHYLHVALVEVVNADRELAAKVVRRLKEIEKGGGAHLDLRLE